MKRKTYWVSITRVTTYEVHDETAAGAMASALNGDGIEIDEQTMGLSVEEVR